MHISHITNYSFLAPIQTKIWICPSLGDLGAAMPLPQWGGLGAGQPKEKTILFDANKLHSKLQLSISNRSWHWNLPQLGGTWGQRCPLPPPVGALGQVNQKKKQFCLMQTSHIPNYSFLSLIEAEIRICPSLGGLGGSNAPCWGSRGLTPYMMVNLGHHMKVTYKISEFYLNQKLSLLFHFYTVLYSTEIGYTPTAPQGGLRGVTS